MPLLREVGPCLNPEGTGVGCSEAKHCHKNPLNGLSVRMFPTITQRAAEAVRTALGQLDLDTEGLWRESGNFTEVQALTAAMLDGRVYDADSHCVVSAIKSVLRQFQPLTTYSRCDNFNISELPAINRQLLGKLANHFARVVENPNNRMTWQAVAIAVGPTLMRRDEKPSAENFAPRVEKILRSLAPSKRLDEARDRSVRVRCKGVLDDPEFKELDQFGKVKKFGFLPNSTDAVVLFDSVAAVSRACQAAQTRSWRISAVGGTKRKELPPSSKRNQRIVRAFTTSTFDQTTSNPLAFSLNDLELADDLDVFLDEAQQIGTAHW